MSAPPSAHCGPLSAAEQFTVCEVRCSDGSIAWVPEDELAIINSSSRPTRQRRTQSTTTTTPPSPSSQQPGPELATPHRGGSRHAGCESLSAAAVSVDAGKREKAETAVKKSTRAVVVKKELPKRPHYELVTESSGDECRLRFTSHYVIPHSLHSSLPSRVSVVLLAGYVIPVVRHFIPKLHR